MEIIVSLLPILASGRHFFYIDDDHLVSKYAERSQGYAKYKNLSCTCLLLMMLVFLITMPVGLVYTILYLT